MITIKTFVFNPFQENTYVLSDESKQCVIIDPGCSDPDEMEEIEHYLVQENLSPVKLVLTHGHVDHILGIQYFATKYDLKPYVHSADAVLINLAPPQAQIFGFSFSGFKGQLQYIDQLSEINFGYSNLKIIHVPGHSPGSIAIYSAVDKFIITGDAIFKGSIGRTDLMGGDYQTLINSIRNNILTLPDDTVIFPGHGPFTTIKYEKLHNPFLNTF